MRNYKALIALAAVAVVAAFVVRHAIEKEGRGAAQRTSPVLSVTTTGAPRHVTPAAEPARPSDIAVTNEKTISTIETHPASRPNASGQTLVSSSAVANASQRELSPTYSVPNEAPLSGAWLEWYMARCDVLIFGDCRPTKKFVLQLVQTMKGEEDSWPHRLEYELRNYFDSIKLRNNFEAIHVQCRPSGCLVYVTGNHGTAYGSNSLNIGPFWDALHRQPWIVEFAEVVDQRTGRKARAQGFSNPAPEFGLLLVFRRNTE